MKFNYMNGIQNILNYISDYWVYIIVMAGLSVLSTKFIVKICKLSNDEKISIAKNQISKIILKLISDAEDNYSLYKKSGKIKRSEVINEVFKRYPILNKATDQNKLISWIDTQIDLSLITLRNILKNNSINNKSNENNN